MRRHAFAPALAIVTGVLGISVGAAQAQTVPGAEPQFSTEVPRG